MRVPRVLVVSLAWLGSGNATSSATNDPVTHPQARHSCPQEYDACAAFPTCLHQLTQAISSPTISFTTAWMGPDDPAKLAFDRVHQCATGLHSAMRAAFTKNQTEVAVSIACRVCELVAQDVWAGAAQMASFDPGFRAQAAERSSGAAAAAAQVAREHLEQFCLVTAAVDGGMHFTGESQHGLQYTAGAFSGRYEVRPCPDDGGGGGGSSSSEAMVGSKAHKRECCGVHGSCEGTQMKYQVVENAAPDVVEYAEQLRRLQVVDDSIALSGQREIQAKYHAAVSRVTSERAPQLGALQAVCDNHLLPFEQEFIDAISAAIGREKAAFASIPGREVGGEHVPLLEMMSTDWCDIITNRVCVRACACGMFICCYLPHSCPSAGHCLSE
jgi:hypothetical protein